MAALSLFGVLSFGLRPPNISSGGGLAFSIQGGAIQASFRQMVIRNPALFGWVTAEMAPAVLQAFVSRLDIQGQGNLFGEPAGRSSSGKTTGVLDDGSGDFPEFTSGEEGPAKQFWGLPGFDAIARTHAEAHAAAWMRMKDLAYSVLRINNDAVCEPCQRNIKYMLGPGRSMTVIDARGRVQTFVGE